MERLIIGVIASESYEYDMMKRNWEDNVDNCSSNIEVYFLYADINLNTDYKIENNTKNSFNFYIKCEEIFENLLYKTIAFFYWVTIHKQNCMVLRSNLSTLFKLDDLFVLYKDFYKYQYFFGGTFVESYLGLDTMFSGTNLTFSMDTLKLIVDNKDVLLNVKQNDDVVLSRYIFQNYYRIHYFYNIKRIDFTDKLLFQYAKFNEIKNVLCYRFKSSSRIKDSKLMRKILKNNFNINYISDQIIFNYFNYLLINFDYNESDDKNLVFLNVGTEHYITENVYIGKIPFKFKLSIKYNDEISLFRICED